MKCLYSYKYQLVEWFHKATNEPLYKIKKRSKKQLYWMFNNPVIVKQIRRKYK